MHFVRRSWKISYTGRLSRLGSPPLSPSPPPSPPFGLGIREEGKSQAFRVFSKGSFVASPRDPYRIFLKEKIPLCSRTADRGGGREGEREKERGQAATKAWTELSLRVILSLYQRCLYRRSVIQRLEPLGYAKLRRATVHRGTVVAFSLGVYIPLSLPELVCFFFSFPFFFFFFFLPLPLPRTFCRVLTARFLFFFFRRARRRLMRHEGAS